jgi:hypothetical protein
MILFQKRFHEGIVRGDVTLTFRAWKTPRVKPGGRYRCHPIGVLEVDEVDTVRLGAVTSDEAVRAGFRDREELVAYVGEKAGDDPDPALVRVRFHHGGDGDRVAVALDAELDPGARRELASVLAKLDARAPDGPWTKKTLALIAKHPHVAASELARRLKREKLSLKADIVKLKKLGLTQSFEVGYELSPRGRAFLDGGAAKPKKPSR